MTVVRLGCSTPKRTMSADLAMRGAATKAEAESKTVLRVIFCMSSLFASMTSKAPHDVCQLAAQFGRLCRVSGARARDVDINVLSDAPWRRRHDRNPIGEIDRLIDVVGD